MQYRNWVDRLEGELKLQGVPARVRHRLVAELRDHAEDLADREGLTMTEALLEQRLGNPVVLASQAAKQSQGATWVSRHPALVFALMPVPLILLAMTMLTLLLVLPAEGLKYLLGDELSRGMTMFWVYTSMWVMRFGAFTLVALLYARMYTRHHVRPIWFALAAFQVLSIAFCFISQLHYSDQPGESQLTIGLSFMPRATAEGLLIPRLPVPGVVQLFQVLVPLAAGGFVIWHARQRDAQLAGV